MMASRDFLEKYWGFPQPQCGCTGNKGPPRSKYWHLNLTVHHVFIVLAMTLMKGATSYQVIAHTNQCRANKKAKLF